MEVNCLSYMKIPLIVSLLHNKEKKMENKWSENSHGKGSLPPSLLKYKVAFQHDVHLIQENKDKRLLNCGCSKLAQLFTNWYQLHLFCCSLEQHADLQIFIVMTTLQKQARALALKQISFQKRQWFTNCCCIALCPLLSTLI